MGALATTVGRWNIFVCEACGEPTGRHKDCEGAKRTATEVVPVDEAAIERAVEALRGLGFPNGQPIAEAVLHAAGESE